jgi:hypothetical protein
MGRNFVAVILSGAALAGCSVMGEPVAAALAGAGTSAALGHSLNGTAYRTFTAPLAEVKAAVLEALQRMGIRLESIQPIPEGEEIVASASARTVYVGLEPISDRTTRVRVAARDGSLFYDSATATEIVLQTEKVILAQDENAATRGASRRTSR